MTIAPRRPAQSPFERLFRVAALLSAAQLLWVFVMGLLAGGQFVADQWPDWDPVAPWPVLAIPSWLTIALGALACVGAVGAAVGPTGPQHAGPAIQDVGIAAVVLVVLPLGLARVYAEPGGVPAPLFGPDAVLGWHWIAAVLQVVTIVALVVRARRATRAARAAGAR